MATMKHIVTLLTISNSKSIILDGPNAGGLSEIK
jgi:hypothetical protein